MMAYLKMINEQNKHFINISNNKIKTFLSENIFSILLGTLVFDIPYISTMEVNQTIS
jgi:hypothetical protein